MWQRALTVGDGGSSINPIEIYKSPYNTGIKGTNVTCQQGKTYAMAWYTNENTTQTVLTNADILLQDVGNGASWGTVFYARLVVFKATATSVTLNTNGGSMYDVVVFQLD